MNFTAEQHAERRKGLGASEVPIALGLSRFQAAQELADVKRGLLPPFEGNRFTRCGNLLEASIAQMWLEDHAAEGVEIFTPPKMSHSSSAILFASPDRVVVPAGRYDRADWIRLLECKNTSAWRVKEFGESGQEGAALPDAFVAQGQTQMEVTGLDACTVVVLIGGNDPREYPLTRDREMGGDLVQFAEKWWADHVTQGLPCPVDGTDAYSEYLRKRYPSVSAAPIPATPELRELVASLRAAKAATKAAEAAEKLIGNQLRAAIGEADGVDGLCTYRLQAGSTYTVTREPSRVLRLAKEK